MGLQLKSISQLTPVEISKIGKEIRNSIVPADYINNALMSSLISCEANDLNALSVEASDGTTSYKLKIATIINPIISALLHVYAGSQTYLTRDEARNTYVPWNLTSADVKDKALSGTLKLVGADGGTDSDNTALSIKNEKTFIIQNQLTSTKNGFTLAVPFTVGGVDKFYVDNNGNVFAKKLSAEALSAVNLSADSLSAGRNGTMYSLSAVSNNVYTTSLSVKTNFSITDIISANVTSKTLSASTVSAVHMSATDGLSSKQIKFVDADGTNLCADVLSVGKQSAGEGEFEYNFKVNDTKVNYTDMSGNTFKAITGTITTLNATTGTITTLNATTGTITTLNATNGTMTNLTAGNSNLVVEGNNTINIASLSAANLSAGNGALKIQYADPYVTIDKLSTNELSANKLSVNTEICVVNALYATNGNLTANGILSSTTDGLIIAKGLTATNSAGANSIVANSNGITATGVLTANSSSFKTGVFEVNINGITATNILTGAGGTLQTPHLSTSAMTVGPTNGATIAADLNGITTNKLLNAAGNINCACLTAYTGLTATGSIADLTAKAACWS